MPFKISENISKSLDFSWSSGATELLNQLKNLSITASEREEITRKNIFNFKLIKFPVS